MSVLVYTESWKGNFRKSTFEAVSYASETAKLLGTDVVALSFGEVTDDELSKLGNYGANKVLSAPDGIGQAIERYLEGKEGVQEALPLEVGTQAGMQTQVAVSTIDGDALHLDTCPECNSAHFVFEEGCKKCHVCGYSDCG